MHAVQLLFYHLADYPTKEGHSAVQGFKHGMAKMKVCVAFGRLYYLQTRPTQVYGAVPQICAMHTAATWLLALNWVMFWRQYCRRMGHIQVNAAVAQPSYIACN